MLMLRRPGGLPLALVLDGRGGHLLALVLALFLRQAIDDHPLDLIQLPRHVPVVLRRRRLLATFGGDAFQSLILLLLRRGRVDHV